MKILKLLLLCSISVLYAKNLDIYVLNPEQGKGYKQFISIVQDKTKLSNESIIIDSRDGKVFFRGNNKDTKRKIKNFYKKKKKAKNNNDVAYALNSIYKSIVAAEYGEINLYFINSILYKDAKYNFEEGAPNDAFLLSSKSSFIYLNTFENIKLKTYILTYKKLFINKDHKDGLERFYVLLSNKLKLNLQTFNTNFSVKKEKLDVGSIDPKAKAQLMKVDLTPPKRLHFDEDEYKIQQNKDKLSMIISNKDRAHMLMDIKLNGISFSVPCDASGVCQFEAHLSLGDNNITYKNLNNLLFTKSLKSSYIPDDEIESYSLGNEQVIRVKKSHRPEGNVVKVEYVQEGKKYSQKVVNGYYEFRMPLKYAENQFKVYQYSGNIIIINAINKKLKAKEERIKEETIAKLNEKKRLEAIAKLKKEEKKIELEKIAQEKQRAEAINKGTNKVINDTEILVNNYSKTDSAKEEYKLQLNSPRKVDSFELTEYDADYDSLDIYIENSEGVRKEIAINITGSGDNVSKTHKINNPFKSFVVNRILIKPKTNLGGVWRIDQALIKYGKE